MSSSSDSTSECWLVTNGDRVIASAELATTRAAKARGLLGRSGIDGVLVLEGVRSVHTFAMRFPIDVAFLDAEGKVLRIVTMKQHRLGRPVLRARRVIEAEAGSFANWGVEVGDVIEIR